MKTPTWMRLKNVCWFRTNGFQIRHIKKCVNRTPTGLLFFLLSFIIFVIIFFFYYRYLQTVNGSDGTCSNMCPMSQNYINLPVSFSILPVCVQIVLFLFCVCVSIGNRFLFLFSLPATLVCCISINIQITMA